MKYLPQLDGLRAFAVFLVCLHHWTEIGGELGIIGVQIFFVLSGFLITGILLREKSAVDSGEQTVGFSLRQFYIRRFLRIFPLYYFCLALFVVLDEFDAREVGAWHALYLSNVFFFLNGRFSDPFSHYFAHFWSLAVEEQFYLFWPLLVLCVPIARLGYVIAAMILVAPISKALIYASGGTEFASHSVLLVSNLDTLGLGALAAWWQHTGRETPPGLVRPSRWLVPVSVAIIALLRVGTRTEWLFLLDSLAVAVVGLYLVLSAAEGFTGLAGRILSNGVMVYLGRISYGLYIWHMFAPPFLRNILAAFGLPESWNTGLIGFSLMTLWTVAAASLTWFTFERPLNELKKFFPYRRRSAFCSV